MSTLAQRVSTVAGIDNESGWVDGNFENASFNNPHGLAIDNNGNLFVADRYNHVIRKITSEGTVTTLAGSPGIAGMQNGIGEEALFFEPWELTVAQNGDLLVADTKNNLIRRVTQEGLVTTIAGTGVYGIKDGLKGEASFGNPVGIAEASNGNIYVADHTTHTIRVIEGDSLVRTIAGTPDQSGDADGWGMEAQFWRPYGLDIDKVGNIIVADEWNHKIKKVTPEGEVTTIVGTGEIGHKNGKALSAQLNYPWDVCMDPKGNIYIGDGYNYVIRVLNPEGEINDFVGHPLTSGTRNGVFGKARFKGVTSLEWSELDSCLYIADPYNDLIRKTEMINEKILELEIEKEIFFPTAFTPNGDGQNDIFRPRGFGISEVQLTIFNEWGQQVFYTKNGVDGWDGTFLNRPLPQGNFAYMAKYLFKSKTVIVSGIVTLLR